MQIWLYLSEISFLQCVEVGQNMTLPVDMMPIGKKFECVSEWILCESEVVSVWIASESEVVTLTLHT